jgi:predicted O-linked N-acetylglucosamine transferase (SPINDLY family)
MNASELVEAGLEAHRGGDLQAAAGFYRQALTAEPKHLDALYFLGVAVHQAGNPAAAAELAARALALAPHRSQLHNLRGMALGSLGNDAAAEASFRRAIAADDNPEAYNNLGILLKKQGRLEDAIAAYQAAIERHPDYADALYNLGNAQRAQGDLAQAAECLRRALEAQPEHANALAALGQVLHQARRSRDALAFFERALALLPGDAALHCDLGDAWQALGSLEEAAAQYREAVALDPHLARAWYAAGCAASSRGDNAAAAACLRKAVEINPAWPEALHNLGQNLFELGQADEALELFRAAAANTPLELPRASIAVMIPGCPSAGNREILEARQSWAGAFLPAPRTRQAAPRAASPPRIGFVSAFFDQANWMKPVGALLRELDRREFEIHLFSDTPQAAGLEHLCRFHYIGDLSNEAAADLIERTAIDLLIDLNGYSAARRLALIALRPAPAIAGWFNLYATSGMRAYDYLVGDRHVIPPEEEPFYREKIVRMPESYLTFSVDYPVPDPSPPPCLAKGAITFGCLAPQYKITPPAIAAWSAILRQAPGSTLVLRNLALAGEGNRRFVHALFEGQAIDPGRIRLLGPLPHYEFLKTYAEIDLALDTFPYNGGTTTTEAIWQGVAVVAFWGDRWVSRTSASILRAGGLGQFVAADADAYIRLAVRLATDPGTPSMLADLRRSMRDRLRPSAICGTAAFARAMERFYRSAIVS